MYADESLAVIVDERDEVGFLLGVHFGVATGVEKDRIEVVQVLGVVFQLLLGEHFGVGAKRGVPEAGLFAQALDGGHGVGDGFVTIAFFFAKNQQMFFRRRLRYAEMADGEA